MNVRRFKPSGTVLLVAGALVIGMELPAMAHQVNVVAHKISGSDIKPNTVTGRQVKESTLGTVPSAKRASKLPSLKWHTLALTNGWSNFYAKQPAAWAVDAQGVVHLRGAVTGGSEDFPFATLPGRLAPKVEVDLPDRVGTAAISGLVLVYPDGSMQSLSPTSPFTQGTEITTLDGASFVR
jgi:hypothetical protein